MGVRIEEDRNLDQLLTLMKTSASELRRIRRYHFVTLILALLTAAYFTRELLLPIVIAIILTLTLLPLVRFGERFGIPAPVMAVSLILVTSLVFVQLGYILSGPAQTLATDAPRIAGEVREKLGGIIDRLSDLQHSAIEITGVTTAPDLIDADGDGAATTPVVAVVDDSVGLAGQLVSALASTGGAIGAALILTVFLLVSGDFYHRRVVEAMPTLHDKKQALTIFRDVERQISRYLGAIFIINAGLGIAVGVAMWLLDLPLAVVWALLAFLLNFIPYVGNILNVALVAAMSFVTFDSFWDASLPPLALLGLALIESNIVTPLLIGRRLELNTVSQLVMVAFWTWIWGVPGAILAVPFLVVVKAVTDNVESLHVVSTFLASDRSKRSADFQKVATTGPALDLTALRTQTEAIAENPRPTAVGGQCG
jgi:predicted PurR-regulated permease PerM